MTSLFDVLQAEAVRLFSQARRRATRQAAALVDERSIKRDRLDALSSTESQLLSLVVSVANNGVATSEKDGTLVRLVKLKNVDDESSAPSEMAKSLINTLNLDLLQRNELHGLDALLFEVLDAVFRSLCVFNDDGIGFSAEHRDDGEFILLLAHLDQLGETPVDAREQSLHGCNRLERARLTFILLSVSLCIAKLGVERLNLLLEQILAATNGAAFFVELLDLLLKLLESGRVGLGRLFHGR